MIELGCHVGRISDIAKDVEFETYSDLFVFGTGGKVSSIRTEADAPDIQVTIPINRFVLQIRHSAPCFYVENLSTPVAARSDVFSILTKPYAAYDAIMFEGVYQINVQ